MGTVRANCFWAATDLSASISGPSLILSWYHAPPPPFNINSCLHRRSIHYTLSSFGRYWVKVSLDLVRSCVRVPQLSQQSRGRAVRSLYWCALIERWRKAGSSSVWGRSNSWVFVRTCSNPYPRPPCVQRKKKQVHQIFFTGMNWNLPDELLLARLWSEGSH